jgi:hypothetical protein
LQTSGRNTVLGINELAGMNVRQIENTDTEISKMGWGETLQMSDWIQKRFHMYYKENV